MSHLVILGASGKTGRHLVQQALDAGHTVTAVVRDPDAFPPRHERLTVLQADVTNGPSLRVLRAGPEVDHLVVALGSRELWGNTVRSEGTAHGVGVFAHGDARPRVWVISAAGVGDSWEQLGVVGKLFARLLLPSVMKEHARQEEVVRASGLPFTILRASGLADGDAPGGYQVVERGKLPRTSIERAALATCLLDHLDDEAWLGRALTVTGA